MSQPRGKCVFCGGTGLTKGHVWPDWLNRIMPYTATHHEETTGYFSTFEPEVPGPPQTKRERQGHARSRKPRNTCLKCNGGWMNGIEDAAIPVASPLILGDNDFHLADHGQRLLAAFLCLISMRMQFLGSMRPIPQSDRRYLKDHHQPPPLWVIWIARFDGEKPDDHWSRFCGLQVVSEFESTPADKIGVEYCNTQCTTMVIGKLCAHLFSSTVSPVLGYDGIRLTKIWPPSGYDINTRFLPGIDDEHVVWLHEALARESKPLPRA
jgi:hypothetical protein